MNSLRFNPMAHFVCLLLCGTMMLFSCSQSPKRVAVAMREESPSSRFECGDINSSLNRLDYDEVIGKVCAQNAHDLHKQLVTQIDLLNKKHNEIAYKKTQRKAYRNALCGSFSNDDSTPQPFNIKERGGIFAITSRDVSIGAGGVAVGALGLWVCQKLIGTPKANRSAGADSKKEETALKSLLTYLEEVPGS
jgi:hypothetical protein